MRLTDIFVSEVRVKILRLFLSRGASEFFHIRDVTRRVGSEINAVRRELDRLAKSGFLKREPRGNRVYYRVRRDYIYYNDLLSLIAKETGLGQRLLESLSSMGNVKLIILSKLFYLGRASKKNEVDLFLIGKINLDVLGQVIREEEKAIRQEINYTVLTEEEFNFRKRRNESFIINLFLEPWLIIFGNEEKYLTMSY